MVKAKVKPRVSQVSKLLKRIEALEERYDPSELELEVYKKVFKAYYKQYRNKSVNNAKEAELLAKKYGITKEMLEE